MTKINETALKMIEYYSGDVKRINHFIKVHSFAKIIAEAEGLDDYLTEIIEATAYTHDIGIKISEEKYGSGSGYYQQIEGPPIAEAMLREIGYDKNFIDRVCFIIAHHHNYARIDGIDYQILIEADFIVNMFEDNVSIDTIKSVGGKVFKTETGKQILRKLYLEG
ncbi:MAG: HD domain-containing protein [Oscillospiraceae bacterium]|nr:HD domain-containing protein [Oscillospiraceae bacterium]